jgi:hypothetical protein
MNCTSCGTRVGSPEKYCPNCGRSVQGSANAGLTDLGGTGGKKLSPSSAQMPSMRQGLRKPEASETASSKRPGAGSSGQASSRAKKKSARSRPSEPKPRSAPSAAVSTSSDPGVGPDEIRALIQDRPDCLEAGLSIYTDSKAEPVGLDYETDMGLVDLLARDEAGGLVLVLMGSRFDEGLHAKGRDLVSNALERVGWIREHVAEPDQEVRAIVLLELIPEDLCYSAAAVAETVAFKTCRLEVSFTDVDV